NWTFDNLNNVILPGLSEDPQPVSLLLSWHNQDLPDNFEISRNDYIQSIQFNRNPFIDFPQWVNNINFGNLTYVAPAAMNTQPGAEQKSMDAFEVANLRCYPNPVQSTWNIGLNATSDQQTNVSWVDASGRLAATQSFPTQRGDNQWQVNVESFSPGIYTVIIQNGDVNTTLRVVVE
ncbi:MAG: T9SS type A sorting domain-containing protein, partial [Flavobacteriales bacterium]